MICRLLPHRTCSAETRWPLGPTRVWLADITYIPTWEGFLYLAFVLDTHSRRIVEWSIASHMSTELVVDALRRWRSGSASPRWDSSTIPAAKSSTHRSR